MIRKTLRPKIFMVGCLITSLCALHSQPIFATTWSADQPEWEMNPAIISKFAAITIYPIDPAMEGDFLDSITRSGAFNVPYPGFTNERISRPLSSSMTGGGVETYFSVGRYLDEESARRVERQKGDALMALTREASTTQVVRLVTHLLGNWAWERQSTRQVIEIQADSGSTRLLSPVLSQKMSSVAFFKIGYTGQVGILEFVPKGTTLETVKDFLRKREGLSGASIYEGRDKEFIVYSEYFFTPAEFKGETIKNVGGVYKGRQAGRVIQNYTSK